jgi:hypothetical protein
MTDEWLKFNNCYAIEISNTVVVLIVWTTIGTRGDNALFLPAGSAVDP